MRAPLFLAVGLTLGCADSYPLQDTAIDPTQDAAQWGSGQRQTVGMVDFLNDIDTTYTLLDRTVGIDSRAALSIVDYRDGEDRVAGSDDDQLFQTIDEVDALYFVGSATLDKIFDYASYEGWIHGSDEDFYGSWDGVSFTVGEAERVLIVANKTQRQTLLYDIQLDSRAASSILDARPIGTVRELSMLYFVGESAMRKLKTYAAGDVVLQDEHHAY